VFRKLGLLIGAALLLSGCTSVEPKPWSAGTGPIKIVASTDVWGSVANLVVGDTATVTALIYNSSQDPHSFEPSARDQLAVNNAEVVIMNGGGYDDFMTKLVAADPTPAIVVNAFDVSGTDKSRNEHIWYDVDQVGAVAEAISSAVQNTGSSLASFKSSLAELKGKLNALKVANTCGRVFATEPVIDYLLDDAGCINVTPLAFSKAIEEERDVSPAVMQQAKKVLAVPGTVLASNISVTSSQISQLESGHVGEFGFGELLPQDPDTGEYGGNYLDMIDGSITMLGWKK
jgi:zinc/manganese transport system substrate-binding protein